MRNEVEVIADYQCHTGENPLWHPLEKKLYWVDIPAGRLFRYDPASGAHEQCYEGRPIGGFTIQADGSLLLFMDRGTIASWRDGCLTEFIHEIPAERSSRFNDVIADAAGRVLCGTMSSDEGKGRLYRLDTDGSLHVLLEGIACSNGLGFTRNGRGLYYTDSFAREIYHFDYEVASGSLSSRHVFARFEEADGFPDGLTVDSMGYVWSALWDGSCLKRFKPDGAIAEKISFPTRKVSSLTFGGDHLTEIYVTTAGGYSRDDDGELAGALFRVRSTVQGVPEFRSCIGLVDSARL